MFIHLLTNWNSQSLSNVDNSQVNKKSGAVTMPLMSNIRIRPNQLLGVMITVLIMAGTIAWITGAQIKANGQAELVRLEAELLDARKQGLKDLVESAKDIILD